MRDSGGRDRVLVTLDAGDEPGVDLLDRGGEKHATLGITNTGPIIVLRDVHGSPRSVLGVGSDGGPLVALLGESGIIWSAP
jgi:hypothetical protein